jgi:hypothetical protein
MNDWLKFYALAQYVELAPKVAHKLNVFILFIYLKWYADGFCVDTFLAGGADFDVSRAFK